LIEEGQVSFCGLFSGAVRAILLLGRSNCSCWTHHLPWGLSYSSQTRCISLLADLYVGKGAIFMNLSSGRDTSLSGLYYSLFEFDLMIWRPSCCEKGVSGSYPFSSGTVRVVWEIEPSSGQKYSKSGQLF
jgi:hypothetical protein